MHKIFKQWPIVVTWGLAVIFSIISVYACRELSGVLINIVVAVIMAGLITIGFGTGGKNGLNSLTAVTEELINAASTIEKTAKDPSKDTEVMLGSINFQSKALKGAYDEYTREMDRLYREDGNYRFCDIADYIHEDLINEVAHCSFNDLLGGTMTGLGILGTFVGLTLGLSNFRNSTAEEMMETITPLIEGIKVAFLTSIFGMVYSLAFGFLYHSKLKKAAAALNDFTAAFYNNVVPRPDHEGFTELLRIETQQKDSMAQFAEDLSISLSKYIGEAFMPTLNQINTTMQAQNETLPKAIGDAILPTMSSIETDMRGLVDRMAETQDQNMEKLAGDFLAHIDNTMGDSMQRFGASIQSVCDWQEQSAENMRVVAEHICDSGEKLNDVNEMLATSVRTMEDYVTRMEQVQDTLNTRFKDTLDRFEYAADTISDLNKTAKAFVEQENDTLASMETISDIFTQKISDIRNLFAEQTEALNDYLAKQIDRIKEEGTQIAEALQAQHATISENIAQQTEQFNTTLDELLDKTTQALLEQEESFNSSLNGCVQETGKVLRKQTEELLKNAERFTNVQAEIAASMDKASDGLLKSSESMRAASTDLSSNLNTAMSQTYSQIDKLLSSITEHLSGTIADIRDVTEDVPKVVKASTDTTNNYIKQLTAELTLLNQRVNALTGSKENK